LDAGLVYKDNGGTKMQKLKFYNLRTKRPMTTDKYKLVTKSGRKFAVATVDGTKMYRIVPKQ
jgi:hypothetical protein